MARAAPATSTLSYAAAAFCTALHTFATLYRAATHHYNHCCRTLRTPARYATRLLLPVAWRVLVNSDMRRRSSLWTRLLVASCWRDLIAIATTSVRSVAPRCIFADISCAQTPSIAKRLRSSSPLSLVDKRDQHSCDIVPSRNLSKGAAMRSMQLRYRLLRCDAAGRKMRRFRAGGSYQHGFATSISPPLLVVCAAALTLQYCRVAPIAFLASRLVVPSACVATVLRKRCLSPCPSPPILLLLCLPFFPTTSGRVPPFSGTPLFLKGCRRWREKLQHEYNDITERTALYAAGFLYIQTAHFISPYRSLLRRLRCHSYIAAACLWWRVYFPAVFCINSIRCALATKRRTTCLTTARFACPFNRWQKPLDGSPLRTSVRWPLAAPLTSDGGGDASTRVAHTLARTVHL